MIRISTLITDYRNLSSQTWWRHNLVLLYVGVSLLLSPHIIWLRRLLLLDDVLILDRRHLIIRDHLLRLLLLLLLKLSGSVKNLLRSIHTLRLLKDLLHLILTILGNL
jgi:hypothetical protein